MQIQKFSSQLVRRFIRSFSVLKVNLGFDPRKIFVLKHIPKYISQRNKFRSLGGNITHSFPILVDYGASAGTASGHYFHQDLLVASFVYEAKPIRHVDVGSRIDGVVAHIASFREVDVMDVRDLPSTGHSNIKFYKADLMNDIGTCINSTDSISCLHAIEHFGLGRYGDPIDPIGHIKGFNNLLKMLKKDGILYISFPISESNQVHFNAHRVFHPHDILSWPSEDSGIDLLRFDFVNDLGNLHQQLDLYNADLRAKFGCGIYTFRKL